MQTTDPVSKRIAAETHLFQNVRPLHPDIAAVCPRCGLALPRGPILSIGPNGLPPCVGDA